MTTTYTDTTNDAGEVTLDVGCLSGTVTSDVIDTTSIALRWWSLLVDSWESDALALEDVDGALGSGEGRMRTLLSREASTYRPGAYFAETITDAGRLDDATQALCGPSGARGANTDAVAELRFSDDNVSWSDYQRWSRGWRSARYVQARVTLYRRGSRWQRHMNQMTITIGDAV